MPRNAVLGALPRAAALPLVLLLLAAAGTPVAGQGHEHGTANAAIAIAHDAPPDGRTFVGNVNHFAVVAHGGDGVPDFHQDVPWRVTLNGATLVETTPDSGHDYDGINAFDIVFPVAGMYAVEALDLEGKAVASFTGTVLPASAANVTAFVRGGATSMQYVAGQLASFSFEAGRRDADGPIPHSDCTFEVARAGRTEFRTKLHTHEETQELDYMFPESGAYRVRVLCFQAYPSARATLFQPVLSEWDANVLPGPPANLEGLAALLPPVAPPADMNAVVTAPAGTGMTLVGTFDPYTTVGPDTLQHLTVVALGADGQPIQHVDFTATFDGPAGRVFASDTLHEYDGLYELTTRQAVPGVYTLRVTAEGAAGEGALAMSYVVLPRATPLTAGLVDVALDAAPVAGEAGGWLLSATTTAGPFAHGELDVRLTAKGSPIPFLQTKLHTHDDGLYPFRVTLPTAEPYTLDVTPFPLTPDLVLPAATSFLVEPAAGAPLPAAAYGGAAEAPEQELPTLPAAALLAGLAAAALLRRRRAA